MTYLQTLFPFFSDFKCNNQRLLDSYSENSKRVGVLAKYCFLLLTLNFHSISEPRHFISIITSHGLEFNKQRKVCWGNREAVYKDRVTELGIRCNSWDVHFVTLWWCIDKLLITILAFTCTKGNPNNANWYLWLCCFCLLKQSTDYVFICLQSKKLHWLINTVTAVGLQVRLMEIQ